MRIALAVVTGLAPLVVVPGLFDFANLPQSAFLAGERGRPPRRRPGDTRVEASCAAGRSGRPWRASSRPGSRGAPWPVPGRPIRRSSLRLWIHWLAAATAYVLLFHLSDRGEDLRPVAAAALAAGAAVAVLGLGQRLWGWTFVPQAFPPAATFANKNVAAQFAVGVLPFALVWMAGARRGRRRGRGDGGGRPAARLRGPDPHALGRAGGRGRGLVLVGVVGPEPAVGLGARRVAAAVLVHGARGPAPMVLRPSRRPRSSVQGRLAIWRNTLVMVGSIR